MKKAKASRKDVLVVEDEPAIARICSITLNAEGFQTEIAANGKIALDMLKEKEYVLCLVDIRTPVMNGIELYKHLQKEQPQTTDKVIFTTGDIMNENVKALLEQTKRFYLPKPFTPEELRTVVRMASSAVLAGV